MGFLVDSGETMTYEESKSVQKYLKEQGAIQFLKLYSLNQQKEDTQGSCKIIWGDEVEFQLLNFDDENKRVRLQLNSKHIFDKFSNYPKSENPKNDSEINFEAKLEYGSWMIETTPDQPFTSVCHINNVLRNFKKRRTEISNMLSNGDKLIQLSVFPVLGVDDFFIQRENEQKEESKEQEKNPFSQSLFSNDEIITKHQRFYTLTRNIRLRRKEKVCVKIPLYIDKNTKQDITNEEPFPGYIYMDAMSFGMGNSCIQMTFATNHVSHARILYDQLAIIAPLFLALSAGSPFFKGKLADLDTRWSLISQSVDDRTQEERDPTNAAYIPKSRYSPISFYLGYEEEKHVVCKSEHGCHHPKSQFKPEYNDYKFPVNQEIIEFIKKEQNNYKLNLDDTLLQHLGFLFIRDALVIYKNKVENIEKNSTEHFEVKYIYNLINSFEKNFQSTNWNSVRFKPPPSLDSNLPWRVEFRPMELQITDEENAFLIFLVTKIAMLFFKPEFNLNFYIPISYVDKNFERAEKRNAMLEQKFYFRKNVFDSGLPQIIEINLRDFFFGNNEFIGLKEIIQTYRATFVKTATDCQVQQFEYIFNFLKERLEGKRLNTASWMRKFILEHPKYQQDSIISQEIAYDLLKAIEEIASKKRKDENFIMEIPNYK